MPLNPILLILYAATTLAFFTGVWFDYNRRPAFMYFLVAFLLFGVSAVATIIATIPADAS